MSEHGWRDGAPAYRTASEPERYRIAALIGGVHFVSDEAYTYADALERIASVERDTDGYVVAVRDTTGDTDASRNTA